MTDITFSELNSIKKDIKLFINHISDISNFDLKEKDKGFFVFISKQIVLLKHLYLYKQLFHLKVLISDLNFLLLSIIENNVRYIYVNERSIIENYMRLITKSTVEDNHITANLFENIKQFDISEAEYSLIISEYKTSCNYIHGGQILDSNLALYFKECSYKNRELKDKFLYYDRVIKIIKTYNKILIYKYPEFISGSFHRKKTILEYLIGNECLDLLFSLNS